MSEFTDRLFGARDRKPSGEHEFDQLCQALGIEHRLTKRRAPQTNGMVEPFNGRISDILKTHHFRSGEDLRATLHRYVASYHHQLPQAALGGKTPLQAMEEWFNSNPSCSIEGLMIVRDVASFRINRIVNFARKRSDTPPPSRP